jgi:CRISPR-associated exonuclease Cas4
MYTASHIAYYYICHRKLWLHDRQVRMEDNSSNVHEGLLLNETSYQQRPTKWTELGIEQIKIDYYDAHEGVVHEVKKSDKHKDASVAQVKYYLYVLERNGMKASYGLLEFPKQRETLRVELGDRDREAIPRWEAEIKRIIESERCPAVIDKPFCKQCAFYEFCYVAD